MPTPKPTLPNETGQMPPANKRPKAQAATAPPPGQKPPKKKAGGKASGGQQPIAAQASREWAVDVLKNNMSNNPYFERLMDPAELDVRNNPNLKPVADSIQQELQEDWLGNLRQLDSASEAQGRGGSPFAAALRARETEETQEAAANALNQLYAGAYENARQRQMQGLGQMLQTQAQAAGIPIEWMNAETNRKGVNVQRQIGMGQIAVDRGRLGLARQQFNFEKQMGLANAQQDALSDYVNLLNTIGGMGGTQSGGGTFVPSGSPWSAALLGGMGGYAQGKEYFG